MGEPEDYLIIETAQDATSTKFAAVQASYYSDPFVASFHHSPPHHHRRQRRPVHVIIKRGTFARVTAVTKALSSYLELLQTDGAEVAQVVILGAGKDTTYFRLLHGLVDGADFIKTDKKGPFVRWVEVDHSSVLREKAAVVEESKSLFGLSVVGSSSRDGHEPIELRTVDEETQSSCHLVAHDLRLDPEKLCEKLIRTGLDPEAPTFIVSECVLMYLPDENSRTLLSSLAKTFSQGCICLYEPILKTDSFGQMMQGNLTKAGVAGPNSCLLQTRSLASHLSKLSESGFSRAVGCDMNQAYETILDQQDRRRASQCEFLDELEEFMLIMQHYCLVVGCTEHSRAGRQLCQSGKESSLGFSPGRCEETGPLR